MEYKSQKVAFFYFGLALLLFLLQVLVGLWLAINYFVTLPQGLVDVFPFSTARAIHTNLLVLWMLLGFMGGTYYIVPVETKSEIYSLKIAFLQLRDGTGRIQGVAEESGCGAECFARIAAARAAESSNAGKGRGCAFTNLSTCASAGGASV